MSSEYPEVSPEYPEGVGNDSDARGSVSPNLHPYFETIILHTRILFCVTRECQGVPPLWYKELAPRVRMSATLIKYVSPKHICGVPAKRV